MPLAEIRDGVVIGMLVGRQEAKGHIFMGSGFDLARAIDPHAVAVKQEPQHHLWRIGRLAAAILGIVRGIDRTKVQRLHHIHQKARKMLLWKPIVQRRRQQQSLIQIVGAKTLSHEQHLKTDAHSSKRFCRTRESIPDTLLVQNIGATRKVRKARSLTAEQFQALLKELHEPFATMALLCVCLGLRISEALTLRWADVDWLGSTLCVQRGIVEQVVADVKTEGSARTFSLTSEL